MVYNLTPVFQSNNTAEIFTALNSNSDGWIVGFILVALYIALILIFNKQDLSSTLMGTSFIMFVICLITFSLGFIGMPVLILPILLFFVGMFIHIFID